MEMRAGGTAVAIKRESAGAYMNSTAVVTSMLPPTERATGHLVMASCATRSKTSCRSGSTVTSGPNKISRAASAPANVPVSQPPVAATT